METEKSNDLRDSGWSINGKPVFVNYNSPPEPIEPDFVLGSLNEYKVPVSLPCKTHEGKVYVLATDLWKIVSTNLDLLGEVLRHYFFNQDDGRLGCYSTFELREDVTQLPDEVIYCDDWDDVWKCSEKEVDGLGLVGMCYMWDGDGVLEFHLPNGTIIENGDCKKQYGWRYIESDRIY